MDAKLADRLEANIARLENDLPMVEKIKAGIKNQVSQIQKHRQNQELFRKRGLQHLVSACDDKVSRCEYAMLVLDALLD